MKNSTLKALAVNNDGIYNKELAYKIGVNEAIVVGELCSIFNEFKNRENEDDPDNEWFYRSSFDLSFFTALKRRALDNAIQKLKELKIIETKCGGTDKVAHITYYKLNNDVLDKILNNFNGYVKELLKEMDDKVNNFVEDEYFDVDYVKSLLIPNSYFEVIDAYKNLLVLYYKENDQKCTKGTFYNYLSNCTKCTFINVQNVHFKMYETYNNNIYNIINNINNNSIINNTNKNIEDIKNINNNFFINEKIIGESEIPHSIETPSPTVFKKSLNTAPTVINNTTKSPTTNITLKTKNIGAMVKNDNSTKYISKTQKKYANQLKSLQKILITEFGFKDQEQIDLAYNWIRGIYEADKFMPTETFKTNIQTVIDFCNSYPGRQDEIFKAIMNDAIRSNYFNLKWVIENYKKSRKNENYSISSKGYLHPGCEGMTDEEIKQKWKKEKDEREQLKKGVGIVKGVKF
jgi:hypothetical protein